METSRSSGPEPLRSCPDPTEVDAAPSPSSGWLRPIVAVCCLAVLAACSSPTDPRLEDPCYSATVYVDTLSTQVDSVAWEWTPGACEV